MAEMSPKVEVGGGGRYLVASKQSFIRTFEVMYVCTFTAIKVAEMTTDIGGVKYYFRQKSTGSRLGSWVMINLYGIIMLGR